MLVFVFVVHMLSSLHFSFLFPQVMRLISSGVGSLESEGDASDAWRLGGDDQTGDFTRNLKVCASNY